MPASAPHPFGDEPAPVADVIDFASRRAAQRRGTGSCASPVPGRPTEQEIAVADVWQGELAKHGANLADPAVRAAVAGVADLMERLVHGAQQLRESGTGSGLDEEGARVMLDLVADLRSVPGTLDAVRGIAEEC
ncbi:hypothetical protein [Kitasatospora cineracea]|uniref:Uncharacterized protein n=1 Tax=Kitasatospora cineracea TaxID=88074 RepID=A0A3N4RJI5_9ACTN|nr:hypothetical protein [Kitasatospora cineracea]RPE27220.1 hypothetical protein EDD38_7364 [Kitasatospora cineracea]RPE27351.1 hypothetical protein EDD38_7496 [Kitasatospora cineracea]